MKGAFLRPDLATVEGPRTFWQTSFFCQCSDPLNLVSDFVCLGLMSRGFQLFCDALFQVARPPLRVISYVSTLTELAAS